MRFAIREDIVHVKFMEESAKANHNIHARFAADSHQGSRAEYHLIGVRDEACEAGDTFKLFF
jgi:hypothetical protein